MLGLPFQGAKSCWWVVSGPLIFFLPVLWLDPSHCIIYSHCPCLFVHYTCIIYIYIYIHIILYIYMISVSSLVVLKLGSSDVHYCLQIMNGINVQFLNIRTQITRVWHDFPRLLVFLFLLSRPVQDEVLPRAMTCGNMLQLPNYSSKDSIGSGSEFGREDRWEDPSRGKPPGQPGHLERERQQFGFIFWGGSLFGNWSGGGIGSFPFLLLSRTRGSQCTKPKAPFP